MNESTWLIETYVINMLHKFLLSFTFHIFVEIPFSIKFNNVKENLNKKFTDLNRNKVTLAKKRDLN